LISASEAQNRFVGIERLTDEEIEDLRFKCESRACEAQASEIGRSRHCDRAAGLDEKVNAVPSSASGRFSDLSARELHHD
jgi:low affinity Fe/Cu permease